ncbi:MAG: ABC transporter permease subunit, partial [Anaerolineae bacterium]
MPAYALGDYLQFALSGLSTGSIYVLIALGLIAIYNVTGVINLAQGEFVMLGAMLAVAFHKLELPLALASVLSVACVTAAGVLTERLTIRPARRAPEVTLIIITIGAGIAIRGAALLAWGTSSYSLPEFSPGAPLQLWGAVLSRQRRGIMGPA